MSPARITILLAGPVDPAHFFSTAVGGDPQRLFADALRDEVEIRVVSFTPASTPIVGIETLLAVGDGPRSAVDAIWTALGAVVVLRVLARYPIGRLVNSFSPVDPSRVFHRAVRRRPEARALIHSSTVLVAADLPATRTAWHAVHAGRVPIALYDVPAAIRELRMRAR